MKISFFKRFLVVTCAVLMLICTAIVTAGCVHKTAQGLGTLETPKLDSGPISGTHRDGVWQYLGIPYAAPPVGEMRWREPQPVQAWEEVRPCNVYGPSCPQIDDDWRGQLAAGKMSEDCLYLNVWTPAESPAERLPVMVWIHGGAFKSGSGSLPLYDGHNLAARGVVVVTINYRLGPFGFLAHPLLTEESPHGTSGNYGLLDQIAALQWVRRNIPAFGGDRDNVTVFGESAGGMSVIDLMVSPLAEGLFHRAIVESGPITDLGLPISKTPTLREAERKGLGISKNLGCDSEDDELAALRARPPAELLEASASEESLINPINLTPNVDGYVLPQSPLEAFSSGKQHRVPLLSGLNANEGANFVPQMTLEQYRLMAAFLYGDHAHEVLEMFPAESEDEVAAAVDRVITQLGFCASARYVSECMAGIGVPSYLYHFVHAKYDPGAQAVGSFHGLEIPYVFGNLDGLEATEPDDVDRRLSAAMMSYWVNFARSGDPNGDGLPQWPPYGEDALYQELGAEIASRSELYRESYEFVLRFSGLSR